MYSEAVLEELVVEKLALIPHLTKLVVGPSDFRSIDKVPETLHVKYRAFKVPEPLHAFQGSARRVFRPYPVEYRDVRDVQFLPRMIDIFSKRWQTLDLISMLQEIKRTESTHRRYGYDIYKDFISIKDSLSTLPTFQKKEEEHSS